MIMEIEKNHLQSNTKSLAIPKAKKCGGEHSPQQQPQIGHDKAESDSDSGSIACPLFMEGLPSDFATNPQLAAIASLLDDEVREETNPREDEGVTTVHSTNSKNLPPSQKYASQPQQSASLRRNGNQPGKARNRRRKKRASPYPRLQDRKNEKQAGTKSASVGEITLFMNMWKP